MPRSVDLVSPQKISNRFLVFFMMWLFIFLVPYYAFLKGKFQLSYFKDNEVKYSGIAVAAFASFVFLWAATYNLLKWIQSKDHCVLNKSLGAKTFVGSLAAVSLSAAYISLERPQWSEKIPDLTRYLLCLAAAALLFAGFSLATWLVCCSQRALRVRAEGELEMAVEGEGSSSVFARG